ncbi:MAG: hypothetical protein GQ531_03570 [Sulfurovum sp.]|nr:hypothetical protein [Sulfurovum sp.]
MQKEFKDLFEESKRSLDSAKDKIEEFSKEFPDEAAEFWGDLKKRFETISSTLKDNYNDVESKTELQLSLGMMEAREKLEQIKYSTEQLLNQASKNTQEHYDITALKTHLAKMESKDLWNEKQKEFSKQYATSKTEVEKMAKKAGKEISDILMKLREMI